MSGASDELLLRKDISNEEDILSEMLSQQQIYDLSNNEGDGVSVCANCGKEGSNFNICNKCKDAKYCNAACKKNRKQHKKKCEKRVAELHEEKLFREPPPEHGDCPICFLRLPTMDSGRRYMSCCGKFLCTGCCHADVYDNQGKIIVGKKCPFCRIPPPTSDEEANKRLKKRVEVGDAYAFAMMGCYNFYGLYGMPQDRAKALEFYHRAAKHGSAVGYNNIGHCYNDGEGVERDKTMASHYYELSAMEGNVIARHNLGVDEYNAGNYDKAMKHFMIAVNGGCTKSLKVIQRMYMDGLATKDQYTNALQSHQAYLNEIKSDQRDKAAAFDAGYKYY